MWRLLRRTVVTVVGFALLALGVIMLALPGPGILVGVVGFAVLATEYVWAQRALAKAKDQAARASAATVAQPWRVAATLTACVMLLIAGVVLIEIHRPFGGFTPGVSLIVGGVIATTTTILSLQQARGGLRRVGHGRQEISRSELPPGAASPWGQLRGPDGGPRRPSWAGPGRRGRRVGPAEPAEPAGVAEPADQVGPERRRPPDGHAETGTGAPDSSAMNNGAGDASARAAGRSAEEAPR